MDHTEKQKNDKVIEFKSRTEPKKERKHIPFKNIFLMMVIVFVICIGGIWLSCPIKNIHVEGMKYYTEDEIKTAIKADHYISNTVFLKIRNDLYPIHTMPFVERIDIKIQSRNRITVVVHENLRAGCILYAGKYVYFDKNGYALEVMDKRLADVPLVTGLSYNNIVISEKLPVKKKGYFDKIIKITTLITENELTIDEIQFKEDGDIILKKAEIDINLGKGTGLDAKLSVLPNVLESVKDKKGTVYMDQYTEEHKIITFRTKK